MRRRQFLYTAALLGSGLIPRLSTAASLRWRSATPMPIRAQELYATVHQGRLLVAGGIARKLGVPYFTDACFSYDPAMDNWSELAALPEPLHHAALVSDGKDVRIVGGFSGGYTHVWRMRASVYRLSKDGWLPDGELPAPQAEGVLACAASGDIHLVTGQSPRGAGNSKRSHHVEVTQHRVRAAGTAAWESLAPIPTARNSATGGWVDGQLVVAGGRTALGNLATTEIYDLKEDRWRSAAPMPLAQAGTASAVVDDGLIVFGGEVFHPQAKVFPNVWRYSLLKDVWSALPDMPTPRHGIGAGRIGWEVFVIGGATEPGASGTSDVNGVLVLD